MKLGILGTGMIVKDLCRIINDLGFSSIYLLGTLQTKDETEDMKNTYHFEKTFYDYDALLASDVEVIYVALPNHLHYAFSKKALEANKHVIIEKPITSNSNELKELMDIAKEKRLMIFEAMNIHYLPAYKSLKEDLSKIGQIKIVNFNYSQYSSRYNAFKEGTILPAFDYTKSGGALMDINVYNVHAILGLFGVPHDAQYFANIERNIDTSGVMLYDYTSFKAMSIGAKDCKAPIVSTLQGDLGTILIETSVNNLKKYSLIMNDGTRIERDFDDGTHRLYYEFMSFIDIIQTKNYDLHDALLQLSFEISYLMETTRRKEGVIFANDQ